MAAPARRHLLPILFSLPALLFVAGLFLLPVVQLILATVVQRQPDGSLGLSGAVYADVWGDPYHYALMWRTIRYSAIATVLSFVLAFPVALYMRTLSPRGQSILGFVLLSPLLTSVVVRTLGWVVLLGPRGLINGALEALGLPTATLLYNDFGVVVGLTHVFVGYMVLSLMTSVSRIDDNLFLAARNLGAGRWTTLLRIALPLSMPGIVAGSVLVFTMSASAYATPMLLGGAKTKVAAVEVYNLAILDLDLERAAAIAAVLFAITALVVVLGTRLGEGRAGEGRRT